MTICSDPNNDDVGGVGGYLILTLKDDKIIVANAESSVLNIIKSQVRKHCLVRMEGWSKEMTYYFKIIYC